MPEMVKAHWAPPGSGSGLPRRARQGCGYEAHIPDLLVGRAFSLFGETAADVADAERAVERQLANPEADTRISPPVRGVPARRR